MGRKLDLTGLTDNEAAHVLQVVQRDMRLRKKEEERLSEMKQELDEEGSRCLLLSRQTCFNQRCCIRCCSPFTFLLNPKRRCQDCKYNICKACRVYNKRDKAWLCSACQKSRLLKTQSLEWFYTNVKKRFKRFGSAKVLKTLYRKHLAEHSALSELTEGSACEESICNEGSICGSDSTFYRQTEEHSVAETLSVARRVAEEAIDEAISKAEIDTSNQEKQDEAHYLREHRGELIEELAKTIVQKIISRRKTLAEMRAEYDQDWTLECNTDHLHQSACDQSSSSLKQQPNLWRSHSAFTLLDDDSPALIQDSPLATKKEGSGSAMTAWKSVDRLDNSVLKSPDGNWIALQSTQLSRPNLLSKRKSLVYSALERESGVVSAYEGLESDNETKAEPDSSWGAVLQEIHRKMTDSNFNLHDFGDGMSPLECQQGSRDDLFLDSEGNWKPNKHLLALLKRKVPAEIRKPSSSRRTSIIDMNFNLKETGGGEEEIKLAAEPDVGKIRKTRKKKKSKKEPAASSSVSDLNRKDISPHPSDSVTPDTLTSGGTTPEPVDVVGDITGNGANQIGEDFTLKLRQLPGGVSESCTREGGLNEKRHAGYGRHEEKRRQGSEDRGDEDERLCEMDIDLEGGRTKDEEENDKDDGEMKYRLYRLVAQSSLTYFSSTEDELDRAGQSEGELNRDKDTEEEDEEQEEETEPLTYRLCQLEREVRATQFSSTEDELDRIGVEEEDGKNEGLAVKVCRLANRVNATQFSSTEDELDRVGREEDGEEGTDEEMLWKLQPKKAQLRDLASLVSASQFSSTEDELDRAGDNVINEGRVKSSVALEEMWEGGESMGDIDMKMFDLRDETVERNKARSDEKITSENVLESQGKVVNVEYNQADVEKNRSFIDKRVTGDVTRTKGQFCLTLKSEKEEPGERREMWLKTGVEPEGTKKIRTLRVTKAEQEYEPGANRPDEREEKFQKESKGTLRKWETAADSDEEDFNRIISSMLMMTLEDMQVETKNKVGENRGRNKELESKQESGYQESTVDAQLTDSPEEQVEQVSNKRSESVMKLYVSGETKGELSGKQRSGDRNGNLQDKGRTDMTTKEAFKTNESQLTCPESKVSDEEKQDGRGIAMEERKVVETQGDTAGCEKTDVNEKHEETNNQQMNNMEQSSTSAREEGFLSPQEIQNGRDMALYKTVELISSWLQQRYSAVSLRSITTEVLKVLNATEELLQGVEGGEGTQLSTISLPSSMNPKKLDQQFCRLEENVYVAAGSVYSLEAELSDLEECARGISSSTSDMELSFLEEQVAAAAAKVHQSDLQICDISARIAALKSAGLNVDPQSRFTKARTTPDMSVTLDSSRQQRRRLPAPPVKGR
ncbi:uncharacterized protein myripa isoform X3 [Leuresthes tenuis]|uniref:uncharacterized protein myripa isoform X3 n=1 Tax=Leuresthes tenuis TaxID=355514 RepID=UPI003B50723C